MSRLTEYIKRYEEVHTGQRPLLVAKQPDGQSPGHPFTSNNFFAGEQSVKFFADTLPKIYKLKNRAISVLDYGCGKGTHVFEKIAKYGHKTTLEYHQGNIQCYYLFDPCVPKYNIKPSPGSLFDVTICADVMEHIPEEDVDTVLHDIKTFTKEDGVVLLSISGNPAIKSFDNGENVHITIKPYEWWLQKIKQHVNQTFFLIYKGSPGKKTLRNSKHFKL